MAHVEETKHEERKHEIKFTIDGEEFETQDRRQPALSTAPSRRTRPQ